MYLILLIGFLSSISVNCVRVKTGLGEIEGTIHSINQINKNVSVFLGIPYAKPPIGDLRFKSSEPIEPWNGVWNSTYSRSSCMQRDRNDVNEDCLFLNIYVPSGQFIGQKPKSVMLWVYGGTFITGTINDNNFNATYLSALGDVIVVEVNYRLSAFGFLYDGSEQIPGNQALTDLLTALRFVQNNIKYFGGDPQSVTIFGESAGSMAVSALVLHKSDNLFQRAILQSGSVDSYIGSEPKESAIIKAKAMAQYFNCTDSQTNAVNVNCLRRIDSQTLVDYCSKQEYSGVFFTPVFGDSILPLRPSTALKTKQYNQNISLLFGTCRDEGAGFAVSFGIKDLAADSPPDSVSLLKAKLYIQLLFATLNISFGKEVADFYTRNLTDADGLLLKHAVADSFGDFQLTCPTIKFGTALANTGKTFAYRLMFTTRKDWTGVQHSDDIQYVFGGPLRSAGPSEEQKQLSRDMIHIWSTFAKTGIPPEMDGNEWPEAIDRTLANPSVRYMALNPNKYEMSVNVFKESCDGFWKTHLDSFTRVGLFKMRS